MTPFRRKIRRYAAALRLRLNRHILLRLPERTYARLPDSWKDIQAVILKRGGREAGFFFIQIGANDGIRRDPIHHLIRRHRWAGILVEPIPSLFEKLKANYRGVEGLIFENVAIAGESGNLDFYSLRPTTGKLPEWHDQVGSLLPDTILRYKKSIPNIEEYIVRDTVRAVTYAELLEKNNVDRVDLLHIDTEGYDYEIIRSIDLQRNRPRMILYESVILSAADRAECMELLRRSGYDLIVDGPDTFAYLRREHDPRGSGRL